MNKKLSAAALALVLGAGYTFNALAQAKPEIMVKQRQAAMTLQGKYFFPLAAMAQGKVAYDANAVARNAGYLEVITKLAWDGFDASTQGQKSAALPEIWKDAAGFRATNEKLQAEVAKLVTASKSGNEAAVKTAIGDVGKVCGSCHDKYRQKQ